MRAHDNLDLEQYKPFYADFHRYSDGIYGENRNIFKEKKKEEEELQDEQLKFTTHRESQKLVYNAGE